MKWPSREHASVVDERRTLFVVESFLFEKQKERVVCKKEKEREKRQTGHYDEFLHTNRKKRSVVVQSTFEIIKNKQKKENMADIIDERNRN